MSIRKKEGSMDVVQAARLRIRNVFSNGVPVYMSFSAGKDSLCMSHLVYDQIRQGRIDASQLIVVFIDEEALYPSMEAMTMRWRKRFLSVGAQFRWYCLPLKQISVLRQLQNSESWITWEPGKEDCWVRTPPPWAIRSCPYLEYVGQMTYQDFLTKITRDGIQMTGVRASESVQRLQYIARMKTEKDGLSSRNAVAPIYDWKDNDIWLYIKEHDLDFPEAYMDLYRVGTPKPHRRAAAGGRGRPDPLGADRAPRAECLSDPAVLGQRDVPPLHPQAHADGGRSAEGLQSHPDRDAAQTPGKIFHQ